MLRPSGSYPRACPYWMHAPTDSPTSLSGISPLATNASLFSRGRHCSTLYDYGFSKYVAMDHGLCETLILYCYPPQCFPVVVEPVPDHKRACQKLFQLK